MILNEHGSGIVKFVHVKAFTAEECETIIGCGADFPLLVGSTVGDSNEALCDKNIRNSNIRVITPTESTDWIFQRCSQFVSHFNKHVFNFDLTSIEGLQLAEYRGSDKGFYGRHIDTLNYGTDTRKLSFSVQLSDSATYTEGDLALYYSNDPVCISREVGSINFFPSWALHEVLPVTSGVRYSLVGWAIGPAFK